MKVKDLQIGDWVKDNFMNISFQVFKISGETVNHAPHSDSGFLEEEIEPIPITPKILEKNGFVKDKPKHIIEYDEWKGENGRICINNMSNTVGRNWYIHIDNEDFETIGGADIQYVHELQHALRLCGIDKEIIL